MTYISWSSDFALNLEDYFMYVHHMNQYDQTFDLNINVGHRDLYLWSSDFALYLEDYLMHEHYYWDMSQYDPKFYLKINIGHCDLYFMVQ